MCKNYLGASHLFTVSMIIILDITIYHIIQSMHKQRKNHSSYRCAVKMAHDNMLYEVAHTYKIFQECRVSDEMTNTNIQNVTANFIKTQMHPLIIHIFASIYITIKSWLLHLSVSACQVSLHSVYMYTTRERRFMKTF